MTQNPFSHIDQRVHDLEAGIEFYGAFLPELGFSRFVGGKLFRAWTTQKGEGPSQPWFGITEDASHRPGLSRIAFWVDSQSEVDRIAKILKASGARELSGPKLMPEYLDTYYAVFFEDPFGNRLEVVYWEDDPS